jgi:hypothetical protein
LLFIESPTAGSTGSLHPAAPNLRAAYTSDSCE